MKTRAPKSHLWAPSGSQNKNLRFDKYKYYLDAVQSPETDAEFLLKVYREINRSEPKVLREDFCGTFSISCEWVKLHRSHQAIGVDLDSEPLDYGRKNYLSKLTESQKSRVSIIQENILSPHLPKTDIIAVFNFSAFFLKERETLVSYFKNCRSKLNSNGLFVMDCFGGPACEEPNVDEVKHRGFTYFWDEASYNPINRHATFFIHFKRKGEKKREKVFRYDWRMWTIPELRDALKSAGFSKTHVYWEGSKKNGEGDGKFRRKEIGDVCEAWVAYIVAEK